MKAHRYYIVHKPFQVLSQFTSTEGKKTLGDFFQVPSDVYPVGRLDYDSEGLLILTNDKELNHRLLDPRQSHEREYWVQLEGQVHAAALDRLRSPLDIVVNGKPWRTKKSTPHLFAAEPPVAERMPPIRFRKNIPTSWISLVLTEGKNRQVRKMCATVGFPVLRLIRFRIEKATIGNLKPGDFIMVSANELYDLLSLGNKP
jgi:23S rRNA pseudouridine2457 synthase